MNRTYFCLFSSEYTTWGSRHGELRRDILNIQPLVDEFTSEKPHVALGRPE